jgi:hypothetical protein
MLVCKSVREDLGNPSAVSSDGIMGRINMRRDNRDAPRYCQTGSVLAAVVAKV